jgi:hypothetical protein
MWRLYGNEDLKENEDFFYANKLFVSFAYGY